MACGCNNRIGFNSLNNGTVFFDDGELGFNDVSGFNSFNGCGNASFHRGFARGFQRGFRQGRNNGNNGCGCGRGNNWYF